MGGEVQKLSEHDLLIYNIFLQIDLFTAIVIPLNDDAGTSCNIKVQTNYKWSVVKLYDHLWLPMWANDNMSKCGLASWSVCGCVYVCIEGAPAPSRLMPVLVLLLVRC